MNDRYYRGLLIHPDHLKVIEELEARAAANNVITPTEIIAKITFDSNYDGDFSTEELDALAPSTKLADPRVRVTLGRELAEYEISRAMMAKFREMEERMLLYGNQWNTGAK